MMASHDSLHGSMISHQSLHGSMISRQSQDDHYETERDGEVELEMVKTVETSVEANPHDNVLTRLETLSKALSRKTTRSTGGPITIDPNDFELQKVLQTISRRADRHGLPLKTLGVEMQDVTVYGHDEVASFAPTIGEVLSKPFRIGEIAKSISDKKANRDSGLKKVNRNINVVCDPGEMVLVLGRPGAGCSTMLKTVAGELDQYVKHEGSITYDNVPQDDVMKMFKKEIIYNPELDVHFPHLTVDQTLKFAIACRAPSFDWPDFSENKYIETFRDILCTVYGLTHTKNTKVGNDYIRGVSGGERKRVSIAEVMTAKPAVLCFDNATRGLDASTALEFAEALRTSTNIMKMSSFVTIYQASQNIYELFDKVVVLYLGRQVYYGRTEDAKAYFENMGYLCPERQSTAEYLTAVTDPIGRFVKPGFEGKVPNTADEFEAYWRASPEFAALQREITDRRSQVDVEKSVATLRAVHEQERGRFARAQSRYTVSYATQLKLCTIRGWQRMVGDKTYAVTNVCSGVFQALVIGSTFWKTSDGTGGAFSRGGVVFFSLLYFALMGMAEISVSFGKRPILFKQKGYSFYHPSAEVFGYILNDIPLKLVASLLFSIVIYFLSNLKADPGAFFTFVLFLNLGALAESTMFQAIASVSPNVPAANAISGIFLFVTLVYTSYMIQQPSMHPWFKWISAINPLLYCFEAMVTTEFHGRKMNCDSLAPSGSGYENAATGTQACSFTGSVSGQSWVSGDRYLSLTYNYEFTHVWRNFGIVIGFIIFFLAINCAGVELLKQSKETGDHLMFLRGKTLDDIVVQDGTVPVADVENQADVSSAEPERVSGCQGEKEGASKDLGSGEIFMWQHVDYTIPYKGETRQLLKDIQGYCKPGTLTALMGESGAGKTTLLNVLSRRIDMGVITGDMLVDGKPIDHSFERRTGYVQQQDLHISELTVRESLQFAARMRRPVSVSEEEKMEYVEKIIDILEMGPYSDALVGDSGSGLNVEQRKKLSVGVELVAKPSLLLFLDEPTSGLDSQSAWAIIQVIRSLANAGQAILCTIHQPSATLIEEFDRLLLLRKGGETVYFGEIGKSSRIMLDYFEGQGARKCEIEENPAEYILEVIGAGATASAAQNWHEVWKASPEFEKVSHEISSLIEQSSHKPSVAVNKEMQGTFATPYFYQLKNVLWRTSLQFWRDIDYFMGKMNLVIITGLFVGFSFWDLKHTVVGMQNGLFATFLCLILSAPLSSQIQDKAIASRELYEVRESKSNTFHWSALLISQVIMEIPFSILASTLFFVCFYFPLKSVSTDAETAGYFWLTYCIFFQLYYITFSLCVLYFSPDLPTANLLYAMLFSFVVAFCSVTQPQRLAPGFWKFMYDASPFTYFVQSLLVTVLHNRKVHCKQSELAIFDPPSGQTCEEWAGAFMETAAGYLTNGSATENCGYCEYSVADEYLETLNIRYSEKWRNVGFFCCYIVFNLFAMFGLYWLFRVHKSSLVGSLIKKLTEKKKN
ncbi:unnamed protein product [Kuraishia capsulata CBS 1993]|uniref:ABC transporter domain-containing protein n=1 Tax=Kuraishia capsulata CBS 1993 TaxID=1382522 RepID=W6MVG3_9ASCO|nr:uncharacterized protein KUCA_T00002236001 [Kuraishia capsulata CBS 1993]CDK26265.1 unnamed protein product [Kuraishia capsulata CBS 1993]